MKVYRAILRKTATKRADACGRALRVAAGSPPAALRPLEVRPGTSARERALPGNFRLPLTHQFNLVGALAWSQRDEAAWLAAIRDDRALKSVAGEVVLAAVYDVIEHDAGLRYLDAKQDGATLAARPNNGRAGVRLGYVIRGAEDHFVPLARLGDVHEAVAFAVAHELNARDCGEDIVQLIRDSGCRGSNAFSSGVGEEQGTDQSRVRP